MNSHEPTSLGDVLASFKPPVQTGLCEGCGVGVFFGDRRCHECQGREERRRAASARALRAAADEVPASFAFARAGFDDATVRTRIRDLAALERVNDAAAGSDSMLLRGAAGLGKSVSAAALAFTRARLGIAPMWVDAFELANAIARSALGRAPQLVADAMAAPLLILDDLASETVIATSPIPEVLHRRHANGAPTIVTTWADLTTLRDRYGDGISRRLHERALVVDFRAPKGAR